VLDDLEALDGPAAEMARRARNAGVLSIWRCQVRSVRGVLVRDGKTENTSLSSASGHGVQVIDERGYGALASRDDFDPEAALRLFDRVRSTAEQGQALCLSTSQAGKLEAQVARSIPCDPAAFEKVDLERVAQRLVELEREVNARVPGISTRLSYRAELDAWRIFRNDGTDVLFAMPRCAMNLRATAGDESGRHAVTRSLFSVDPQMPWDEEFCARFLARAEYAAKLARLLPDAPTHAAGSFPIVIDYGLAKGLAHEAFGHASEADGFRSSVLAHEGRFRSGKQVGPQHVSVIDEPVSDDHAWQPFSANGVRRERAVVVDHGKLGDGLSDIWSAEPGGVRLTGAARAESYRNAPQPRMTNIRIEVDEPLAAPGEFEDYGPDEVRELLAGAGIFKRHPRVTFLTGYCGGQVNPASGDFVFQCNAIYDLDESGATLHKPAIFSGSMFGALESIREGFGPLLLDSIGYCGKWGQRVPSSGGSHYFLMLEPHDSVQLGGT